jgi:hypothetical protein
MYSDARALNGLRSRSVNGELWCSREKMPGMNGTQLRRGVVVFEPSANL